MMAEPDLIARLTPDGGGASFVGASVSLDGRTVIGRTASAVQVFHGTPGNWQYVQTLTDVKNVSRDGSRLLLWTSGGGLPRQYSIRTWGGSAFGAAAPAFQSNFFAYRTALSGDGRVVVMWPQNATVMHVYEDSGAGTYDASVVSLPAEWGVTFLDSPWVSNDGGTIVVVCGGTEIDGDGIAILRQVDGTWTAAQRLLADPSVSPWVPQPGDWRVGYYDAIVSADGRTVLALYYWRDADDEWYYDGVDVWRLGADGYQRTGRFSLPTLPYISISPGGGRLSTAVPIYGGAYTVLEMKVYRRSGGAYAEEYTATLDADGTSGEWAGAHLLLQARTAVPGGPAIAEGIYALRWPWEDPAAVPSIGRGVRLICGMEAIGAFAAAGDSFGRDDGGSFAADGLLPGAVLTTGCVDNPGPYTITATTADALTVADTLAPAPALSGLPLVAWSPAGRAYAVDLTESADATDLTTVDSDAREAAKDVPDGTVTLEVYADTTDVGQEALAVAEGHDRDHRFLLVRPAGHYDAFRASVTGMATDVGIGAPIVADVSLRLTSAVTRVDPDA